MKIKLLLITVILLGVCGSGYGQVSYLGLDGGLEGSATIDNTTAQTAPAAGVWRKANATQTIANSASTVRSGANSLSVNNSSTTGRRVWSPNFTVSSTTSQVTVQFYKYVANITNSQEEQRGIINNTETLSGTYNVPLNVAGTWVKVTYTKASSTFTTISGLLLHRQIGTGGNMFIDDMAVYTGAVDTTIPNVATAAATSVPTTSSLTVGWTAASGGVDGGGYLVVRGTTDPTTAPNVNGIYAVGNTIAAGMTVVYRGTGTSFIDTCAAGTQYFYRVYTYDKAYNYAAAATCNGTTSASASPPTLTSPTATSITDITATLGANVTADGGATISSRGTVWGTAAAPTGNSATTSGTTGVFTTSQTGFSANTLYTYRGFAANVNGTGYSPDATFTTLHHAPNIGAGSGATSTSIVANWTAPTGGGVAAFTYQIEIDDDSGFGSINATQSAIASGTTTATFAALSPSTTYYYRVRAVNTGGNSAWSSTSVGYTTLSSQPEINVKQSLTSIAHNGTQTFANTAIGATTDLIFTIENTGTANLTFTTPLTASGDYSIITPLAVSPVAASGTTTFTVRFTPTTTGTRTGSVTIGGTNDTSEPSYTINFTGTATSSNLSDIIANATYVYNSNIAYANYQIATITNTSNSIDLFKFDIRDGGTTTDNDLLPTILSGITFNVTNITNIRTAALFNGNALVSATPTINTGAGTIAFSGLSGANVTANDGLTNSLTLRVSFNGNVTDNQQIQVTIANANVAAAGSNTSSTFTAFTSVVSSTTTDRNKIEVTADRLAFVQQPTANSIGVNLTPSPTVSANDSNGNRDLDVTTGIVTITSTGTLSSTQTATPALGLATFASMAHSNAGTWQLTATYTPGTAALTSILSNTFIISSTTANSYRTASAGTWPTSGTATWERFVSGSWGSSTAPAASTTDLLIIRHAITSSGAFAASGGVGTKMQIDSGGTFTNAHNSTFQSLQINSGGKLIVNDPAVDILATTGTVTVESGGTVVINSATLNNADGFWEGIENFKSGSTLEIQNWDWDSSPGEERLIDSTNPISVNSSGYYFGNILFNATPLSKAFTFVGTTGTHKLCENNLTVTNGSASFSAILTGVNANAEIGGTLNVNSNKFAFGALTASTVTHTIKGNLSASGGTIDLNQTSGGAATVFVNLGGNLEIPSGTSLISTDDGCKITFNSLATQTASIAGTLGARVDFEVASGSTTQLINQNFPLTNATNNFSVLAGGILEFNGFDITGSGIFDLVGNGTLRITSANGVNATGATGNVQSAGTRTFSQTGIYHYVGSATPQGTGTAMTSGSTAKRIIIDKTNATDIVNLTQTTGTTNELYIKKGVFVETETANVLGAGNLTMDTDGKYNTAVTSTTVPKLSGTYTLSGLSTIDLNAAGNQVLRGAISYRNLNFSTSGTKTVSSAPTSITGTITVQNTAILDAENNEMGSSGTNLTMTNTSRYITDGAGTKPDAGGVYTLGSATTIEFANSSGAGIVRLTPDYAKVVVSGSNVSNNSLTTGIKFQTGGTFTVTNTGTFKLLNTAGFNGVANGAISTANNPTITLTQPSSKVEYAGASQTITPITIPDPYCNVIVSGTGTKTIPTNNEIWVVNDFNVNASAVKIESGATLIVENKVDVNAAATMNFENSGSLVQTNNGASNSGKITYNRNTASGEETDYTYWSTPVSNQTLVDVSPLTKLDKFFYFDSAAGNWVQEDTSITMIKGKGYIIRGIATPGSYTASFYGEPNNGIITIPIVYDGTSVDGSSNLIGNPYPSAIDAVDFLTTNAGVIEGTIYFWTHNTKIQDASQIIGNDEFGNPKVGSGSKAYTSDDYASFNLLGGVATGGSLMSEWVDTDKDRIVDLPAEFTDRNGNSILNTAEWTDSNANKILETNEWTDINTNNVAETGEWTDLDKDGVLDLPSEWTDTNNNSVKDFGEWTDSNADGIFNTAEWTDTNKDKVLNLEVAKVSNTPNGKIAAGQAFFATSLLANGSVSFDNSMRLSSTNSVLDNSQFFKTKKPKSKTEAIEKHRVWLNLTNTKGIFKQTLIGYMSGATNEYDKRFDGISYDANEFADFYSISQDKNLVIQGRALPFDENDQVPLGFRASFEGDFSIKIDQADGLLTNQAVFIEDKLMNTTFDLRSGPYNFTTKAGTFNERFVLRYGQKTLETSKFDDLKNQVVVTTRNKQIKINSIQEDINTVAVYDLLGKLVFKKDTINNKDLTISTLIAKQQLLLVKVKLENGQQLTKKVLF